MGSLTSDGSKLFLKKKLKKKNTYDGNVFLDKLHCIKYYYNASSSVIIFIKTELLTNFHKN